MSRPPLPANWPTLRKLWIGSLIPGSTEAVDVVDHAARVQAAQVAAALESARKRSKRVRKAIRQAAGIEPMADGAKLAAVPLHWAGWPGAIADRIAANPARFGLVSAPCDDVIRDEWDLLKRAPTELP